MRARFNTLVDVGGGPAKMILANSTSSPHLAYQTLKKQIHHHHPTPFLFNSLILGYAGSKNPQFSLTVYKLMAADAISPDKYTIPAILKSCAEFSGIQEARQLHGASIKMGFLCDLYVQNSLIHVYCKCADLAHAGYLFDDMPVRDAVSWNALISGLVKAGFFSEALRIFGSMDKAPNPTTLVSVLAACGRLRNLAAGKTVHGLVLKYGFEVNSTTGNSLLDMYVKCACLDEAEQVFEGLADKDLVTWTTIINGFARYEKPKEALDAFHSMRASGIDPDKFVLSSVLSACASSGALDSGRWVDEYVECKGIERDVHIGTALVDMYAKCGLIERAVRIFDNMPQKNVSSWNALIGGLAMHGRGKEALNQFNLMTKIGIIPNEITFIATLSGCSHSGLIDEGRDVFDSMEKCFHLTPRIEHYGCMVDTLCRAGLLDEANELIKKMPMRADALIWGAMLSACKGHRYVELSRQILGRIIVLEPCDSGVYVLLSNVYAKNDRWGDVTMMRWLMREKGIKKDPGSSIVVVNGKAHEFLVGENDHPQREEIWQLLFILAKQVQVDEQWS